ncbi:ATP-binding cassette domain-containing protein [Mesoplasma florum]|uniref:ATP-binding cassette domain-containing protein n=1 Tax=Mesoplasma florum TaxID=2151 RepID=UPI000D08A9BE|nr:ATP-binding cassette domain-containing protein [Mesoplasma florum]AVN60710.1 hypothetical protein CG005_00135 [Mesoplasma florum]
MSIKLKNINIDYGNFLAVDDLSIEIKKGELVSLLGPSGCGKTTALNAIAGLINTTSGQMLFDGVDVTHKPSQKRNIGLVFQSYALYTHMSVYKNIAYPLYHSKTFKKELKVENFLNKLRLKTLKESEDFKIIIDQQNAFDNYIVSFKQDLEKILDQKFADFLKINKSVINNYLNLVFENVDSNDSKKINVKNQLKSYLYDKAKIKFNKEVNKLNEYIIAESNLILKNEHDIRYSYLLEFFKFNTQKTVKEFWNHSKELTKTMKKTKKNISKLQTQDLGFQIFTKQQSSLYQNYLNEKSEASKRFFEVSFKEVYLFADNFNKELKKFFTQNMFVNSKFEKLISQILLKLKANIKNIQKDLKNDSKILNENETLSKILFESRNQIVDKINSELTNLKTLTEEFKDFIEKMKYFDVNFEQKLTELISPNENSSKIYEIDKIENGYFDKLLSSSFEIISSLFAQQNKAIWKELETNSKKIDTKEQHAIIKKSIYSKNRKIKELVYQTAKQVEIENQLNKKPSELSGGQQQRVAIARAIVKKPNILLMDEPLSNLDAKLRLTTREWIKRFQQSVGITTIFVTHDQEEAMSISDSIFVMNKGVLQQSGSPLDIYNKPANEFVANFIGTPNINFIENHKRNGVFTLPSGENLKFSNLDEDIKKVKFGVRPEKISLKKTPGAILLATGSVALVEQLGKQNHVKIKISKDLELTVVVDPSEWLNVKNKEEINLYVKKDEIYIFGEDKNIIEAKYAK